MAQGDGLLHLNNSSTPLVTNGVDKVNAIANNKNALPVGAADAAHAFVSNNPGSSAALTGAVVKIPGINPLSPALTKIAQADQITSSAAAANAALTTPQIQAANHSFPMKIWGGIKEIARDAMTISMAPIEGIQALVRNKVNEYKTGASVLKLLTPDPMGAIRQTTLYNAVAQDLKAKAGDIDPLGNGIFPGGTAAAAARKAAAEKWSVNGEAADQGNLTAAALHMDPNSVAYKSTAAIVNLLTNFKIDPWIISGKANKASQAFKEAAATKETMAAASTVAADADRAAFVNHVNQLKAELLDTGDAVAKGKIQSVKGIAEAAKSTVTAASQDIHQADPQILDITNQISKAQDLRTSAAQLKNTIQAHYDEFQKTIKENADITNPYADRLNQANDSLRKYDLTISSLQRQIKPLEDARRAASAVLAKAMDEHATDLITKSQEQLTGIGVQEQAMRQKLATALEHLGGISSDPRGIEVDYNKVADLISGRYGTPLVEHLINSTNPINIWRDFKKAIPMDVAIQLSKSNDRQSVLSAIAPLIGGKIEGALPMTAAAKIKAGVDGLAYTTLPTWVKSTLSKASDKIQSLTSFVPKGQVYHIDDTNSLANAIDSYGRYLKLPKEKIDELLNKLISAQSNSEKGMVASRDLFNAIYNNSANKLNDFQAKALFEATRIFDGGKTGMSTFWASRHAAGAHLDFAISGGQKVTLNGPHLESELLNSTIYLPSPTEIKSVISALSKTKSLVAARAVTKSAMEAWRTSKLLRPAYMVRNLMEMQVRQYLQGSVSFIQHPAASLAMILGKSDGPAWRQMLQKMEKFSGDALGNNWKNYIDDADNVSSTAAINEYNKMLASNIGSADSRVGSSAALQGFASVEFGHPKFFTGHAFEIGKLNNDSVAKILAGNLPKEIKADLKAGKTFNDSVIDYFHTGPGKSIMDKLANARPEAAQLFKTRDGIKSYIFDVDNGIQARLDEMTGGLPGLLNLVAHGSTQLANGKVLRIGADPLVQRQLAADLKKAYGNATELNNVKVNVRLRDAAQGMNDMFNTKGAQHLTNAVDAWFRVNNKFEKNISMGPEFRVEYWNQIAKLADSLDAASLAKLQSNVDKSLLGIKINGKALNKNSLVYKQIMAAKGDGSVSLDVANEWAADKAATHVKGLFYDAYNNRNIFHATRFAVPFGQAWWDTLERWAKLGKENPIQAYKAATVLNRLEHDPNTSAVYGAMGVTGYDPSQGFIQQDPNTGQPRIYIPVLGTALAALTSAMSGVKSEGSPFQIATNPIGLNFALGGGSLAPGVGPGITIPAQQLIPANWWNGLPPAVQNVIFPFGKPADLGTAISSAILPAWASKLTNLFSNGTSSQATAVSTLRPTMDYLASSGGYDILNPDDQTRLINDSTKFARFFGAWTGIAQSILPTSPMLSAVAKTGDGTVVAQAAIYAHFQNLLNTQDKGDYYKAVRDTLNTFGAENIYALITNTKGGSQPTNQAYQFLTNNPGLANKYQDVFTLFFPGGGFSQALYQQQLKSGQRIKMSPDQVVQQANYLLYMAAKDQIDIANADDPTAHQAAMDNLKNEFGGDVPKKVTAGVTGRYANPTQYMINQITKALKEPAFANTPAGQAAKDYLYLRSQAMQDAADAGLKSLSGVAMADTRDQLRQAAQEIDKHYGGEFAVMFQSVFENEVRN